MSSRLIVHLDMDAFYASVEVREQPELAEQPVAVIATARRGAVMTANYVARTYGVHSAMPVHQATRRCPALVLIPARMELYREVSTQIHAVFARVTPLIEPLALDEAYLDVSREGRTLADAAELARELQEAILAETRLTASAGVAHNKFLAKLGSGLHKPAGLTVIRPEEVDDLLDSLSVEDFYGVGPVTARKLQAQGVRTGADLRRQDRVRLQGLLGKLGTQLYDLVRGLDERPVEPDRATRSVGVEHTFETDRHTLDALRSELSTVASVLEARLQGRHLAGRTVTLKLRYSDWSLVTRQSTGLVPVWQAGDLERRGLALLTDELLARQGVRLLGLSVSNFSAPGSEVLL